MVISGELVIEIRAAQILDTFLRNFQKYVQKWRGGGGRTQRAEGYTIPVGALTGDVHLVAVIPASVLSTAIIVVTEFDTPAVKRLRSGEGATVRDR